MEKILVTGDKGYLGSVLTQKLSDYIGFDVADGKDVAKRPQLEEALKTVDTVVHLAAIVGEAKCSVRTFEADIVNVLGTVHAVTLSKKRGIPKFLFASTCSVYGDYGNKVVTEDDRVHPWGIYAQTKEIAERWVLDAGYSVLRFGSLYGGHGGGSDSLPEVFKRVAQQVMSVKVRDGASWRPLTHVEDAADAILFLLKRKKHPKILNVVGDNIRKRDLARLIAKRCGATVKVAGGAGRSYRVSSKRLLNLGFKFKWTVERWLDEQDFPMETV